MSIRCSLTLAIAASLVAACALSGCAAAGTTAGPAAGSTTASSSTPSPKSAAAGCAASGTSIPAGTYSTDFTATLNTAMQIDTGGVSIPNAGSGTEAMDGTVRIVSNGKTVTGLMSLTGTGTSEVGGTVHSKDAGDFTAQISGPANNPIVTGNMGGAWETLDAPVQGSGSSSVPATAGLHVTGASCTSVSGDAIAMFSELAAPVKQYITVSGSGAWTATRK